MNTANTLTEERILPAPAATAILPTEELRSAFLVEGLFQAGSLRLVYTHLDRMILGGVVPEAPMRLAGDRMLGTSFFTERREVGVINLGGPGIVRLRDAVFGMDHLDSAYIGMGEEEVVFEPAGGTQLPQFYLLSCPAHSKRPSVLIPRGQAETGEFGDARRASRRRIHRCIHPGGAASCQLVMGYTELAEGSVWNTIPPHTHGRRSEIYLYFDLGDEFVVHLLGEPERTRHLIVRDHQAVLSPSWSIHSGAGTANYRFVWGMAGENMEFSDMDSVEAATLR